MSEIWKAEPAGRNDAVWEIRNEQRLLLADVNPTGLIHKGDAERDARKMAAAPELLAALRWVVGSDPLLCDSCHTTRHPGLCPAHAAIAKAEGREP